MEGAKGSEQLSKVELAIHTIIEFYEKNSSKEGIKKKKFREMLKREMNHMLTNTKNKAVVGKKFHELDQDGDGVIDFNEYWTLIETIVNPIARDKQ